MNICIIGAAGRMGKLIASQVIESADCNITGAIEHKSSPYIGQDIGLMCGAYAIGVLVESDIFEATKNADVIIDFSGSHGTESNIENYRNIKKPIVIGSTGLNDTTISALKELSKLIPMVFSPNMSMGVNLLFKLTEMVSNILKDNFDIEIVESHHNRKKDAPSGTAMKLAEIIAETLNRDVKKDVVYGRSGLVGERKRNEIGVHAIRGGDIIGEHTVMYCGTGEIIELTHKATSRNTFAAGALNAAKWIYDKSPGFYTMFDVLGIK